MASTSSGFNIPCLRDPPDRGVSLHRSPVPTPLPSCFGGSVLVSPGGHFCVSPNSVKASSTLYDRWMCLRLMLKLAWLWSVQHHVATLHSPPAGVVAADPFGYHREKDRVELT